MRILLYAEPHPMRDTETAFNVVARRWLRHTGIRDGIETRLLANEATLAMLPTSESRVCRLTADETSLLKSLARPWDDGGLADWLELMEGTGTAARAQTNILSRLRHDFAFDAIVYWGENGAIRNFARAHGIPAIACELGCTRPPYFDSVAFDTFGTNGSASVARLSIDDLRGITCGASIDSDVANHLFASRQARLLPFTPGRDPSLESFLARPKTAVLPLQLYDDANLLRFSPYARLVDVVLELVPAMVERGWDVIVRPHPASPQRGICDLENEIARTALDPWRDHVLWSTHADVSTAAIAARSKLVVTVNSSAGFEAAMRDQIVVVVGDAVFKPAGLFPSLDEAMSGNFDLQQYRSNLGVLRQFMLGGYLQPARNMDETALFDRTILDLVQAHSYGADDAKAICRTLYSSNVHSRLARARYRATVPGAVDPKVAPPVRPRAYPGWMIAAGRRFPPALRSRIRRVLDVGLKSIGR